MYVFGYVPLVPLVSTPEVRIIRCGAANVLPLPQREHGDPYYYDRFAFESKGLELPLNEQWQHLIFSWFTEGIDAMCRPYQAEADSDDIRLRIFTSPVICTDREEAKLIKQMQGPERQTRQQAHWNGCEYCRILRDARKVGGNIQPFLIDPDVITPKRLSDLRLLGSPQGTA
ncbi:MAG TPA: hypothetical protein VMT99_04000 [Candidatus Paceibacterota bacterium]|nr:hypothetical protein [Candidatus Paceibacterota bacterium]